MPAVVAKRKSGRDHGHDHIARIKNHGTPSPTAPEDWHAVCMAGVEVQFHVGSAA